MNFIDLFDDVTKRGTKIPTNRYLENGLYPIIDQGQSEIAGYTNETKGLFTDIPAIIFGDHTRIIKYVDTPCFLGADGVKLLKAKAPTANYKYLYYALCSADIPNTGYNRHFKWLKEIDIPDYSDEEQRNIVAQLEKLDNLIILRKQQLSKLDELVKARFVELFGEAETLIHNWDVKKFAEVTINLDSTRKPVKDADRQKMQGQYPYYGATGIVDHVNDYRIDGTFLLISEDGKALEFRNKDIAFIASGKIWVNNHAHVLQCTEDIEMIFLMYYMNFRNISDWVTGIDQKKLNRANMDKIPVGLPHIELQKQFSVFVKQTDKSKSEIQKSLEKLETLKKALMQKYFG